MIREKGELERKSEARSKKCEVRKTMLEHHKMDPLNKKTRSLFVAIIVLFLSMPIGIHAQTGGSQNIFSVPEPPNLGILQDSVKSYIKSGAYEKGIAEVIDSAKAYIESRYTKVEHPAIVFDIDETSLSNIKFEYRYSFGFEPALWNAWVKEAAATAIKPTLELAKWAAETHIPIFFITGRQQLSARLVDDPTVRNLKKVGYPDWAGLYFKDPKKKMTTIEFKTSARKEIAEKGYTIIANIGDQYSDLVGGYAERCFKLPDPMYYIP